MTKPKPNKTNHCLRCGKTWIGRTPFPAVCPKCHSPYWRTKKRVSNYGRKRIKVNNNARDSNTNNNIA